MAYVIITANKLFGENQKGSGPKGKYMTGDLVDETMEPQHVLDLWIANGQAKPSTGMDAEKAKRAGEEVRAESEMAARKVRAERDMARFDSLDAEDREHMREHGGSIIPAEVEEVSLEDRPRRKRGRPRKDRSQH